MYADVPGEAAAAAGNASTTGGTMGAVGACGAGEWACADGARCIEAAWRCDARIHCADASDERDCSAYTP